MIGRLRGPVSCLEPGLLLVDVGGVGYLVHSTLRESWTEDEVVSLWVHTQVRDDSIVLYGFGDREELEAFRRLIAVAGIGPKTALAVLSGLRVEELADAVDSGDFRVLQRAPGIGRKTADRIILELRGRLQTGPTGIGEGEGRIADSVSALVNLGYSEREASKAVMKANLDGPDADLGELLRLALQILKS